MGALNACREFQPDVVILDIMLPDIDGLRCAGKIREFSYCSILFYPPEMMISIKSSVFPAAAMIILPSPSAPEVVFRVKAQLRRQQYQKTSPDGNAALLKAGSLTLIRKADGPIKRRRNQPDRTGIPACCPI